MYQRSEISTNKAINHTQYAFTDEDIKIANTARNIRDKLNYLYIRNQETGIIHTAIHNEIAHTIIELPAISNHQYSPIAPRIKEQMEHFRNFNRLQSNETTQLKYPIKILSPYKLDAWHWNVLEIVVNEDGNIECKRYDTDGKSKPVEKNIFDDIQKRDFHALGLKQYNIKNQENDKEEYKKGIQRGVNCGLGAGAIMHDLKFNNQRNYDNLDEILESKEDYNTQDIELRKKIDNLVHKHLESKQRENFCKPIDESQFIDKLSKSDVLTEEGKQVFNELNLLKIFDKDKNAVKDAFQGENKPGQFDDLRKKLKKNNQALYKAIFREKDGAIRDHNAVLYFFNDIQSNQFKDNHNNELSNAVHSLLQLASNQDIKEDELKSYANGLNNSFLDENLQQLFNNLADNVLLQKYSHQKFEEIEKAVVRYDKDYFSQLVTSLNKYPQPKLESGQILLSSKINSNAQKELYNGIKEYDDAKNKLNLTPTHYREKFINYIVNVLDSRKICVSNQREIAKDPKKHAVKIKELLDNEGLKLYEFALQEEQHSKQYRDAVFNHSTLFKSGSSLAEIPVIIIAGPSASGKSTATKQVIDEVMKLPKKQDEKNAGNYFVTSDGGVCREISQMRKLTIRLANTLGYPGVEDLHDKSKILGEVKKFVKQAALAEGTLGIVMPKTFSIKGTPVIHSLFDNKAIKNSSASNKPLIFAHVKGKDEAQFKQVVNFLGNKRAWKTEHIKDNSLDLNDIDGLAESKSYGRNGFEFGKKGSKRAEEYYKAQQEKNHKPILTVDVINNSSLDNNNVLTRKDNTIKLSPDFEKLQINTRNETMSTMDYKINNLTSEENKVTKDINILNPKKKNNFVLENLTEDNEMPLDDEQSIRPRTKAIWQDSRTSISSEESPIEKEINFIESPKNFKSSIRSLKESVDFGTYIENIESEDDNNFLFDKEINSLTSKNYQETTRYFKNILCSQKLKEIDEEKNPHYNDPKNLKI